MKLLGGEPCQTLGEARANVPRADGRVKALADVGEEEEPHVVVKGERLAPGESRPRECDDGGESKWRARQGRASRLIEVDNALLKELDVSFVQGERSASEPLSASKTDDANATCGQEHIRCQMSNAC